MNKTVIFPFLVLALTILALAVIALLAVLGVIP